MFGARAGGESEGIGRFPHHAELTARQLRGHVFTGLAAKGQLEIMNGSGPVERDRAQHAPLNPVDQVRPATSLDDVSADGRHAHSVVLMCLTQAIANPPKISARQLPRQRFDPFADAGAGINRSAQILVKYFGRT